MNEFCLNGSAINGEPEVERQEKRKCVTIVYRSVTSDEVNQLLNDPRCSAISRSDALAEKEVLEGFIRDIAHGRIQDPEARAIELMEQMQWG